MNCSILIPFCQPSELQPFWNHSLHDYAKNSYLNPWKWSLTPYTYPLPILKARKQGLLNIGVDGEQARKTREMLPLRGEIDAHIRENTRLPLTLRRTTIAGGSQERA